MDAGADHRIVVNPTLLIDMASNLATLAADMANAKDDIRAILETQREQQRDVAEMKLREAQRAGGWQQKAVDADEEAEQLERERNRKTLKMGWGVGLFGSLLGVALSQLAQQYFLAVKHP